MSKTKRKVYQFFAITQTFSACISKLTWFHMENFFLYTLSYIHHLKNDKIRLSSANIPGTKLFFQALYWLQFMVSAYGCVCPLIINVTDRCKLDYKSCQHMTYTVHSSVKCGVAGTLSQVM